MRPIVRRVFSIMRKGVKKSDNAAGRLTGRFVNIATKYVANGMVIKPVQIPRDGSD